MLDDRNNAAAEDNAAEVDGEVQPQNAGDGAPVFVGSVKEYSQNVIHPLNEGFFRSLKHHGWMACLVFAILYVLVFAAAEKAAPQLYRAWLDLCMPLAEFVGGWTPRAERIMGQLTENGYAERANAALHGIAMAKVFMIAMFVFMLKGIFYKMHSPPVLVSCTRGTHTKIWLRMLCVTAVIVALAAGCIYVVDFYDSEKFGNDFEELGAIAKSGQYHRGNFGMLKDLIGYFFGFLFLMINIWGFAIMRPVRFTIVEKPPAN